MGIFHSSCNCRGDKDMEGRKLLTDREMYQMDRRRILIDRSDFGQYHHYIPYKQNLPLWSTCLWDTQNITRDCFDCHEMCLKNKWETKCVSEYVAMLCMSYLLTNNRRDLPGGHSTHDVSSYACGTLLYVPIGHAVKPPSHVAAAIVSLAQYPPTLHFLYRGFSSEG